MNELNCKTETCDNTVECDTDVVAITCSSCCTVIGLECYEL